jgi:hypothetical protein
MWWQDVEHARTGQRGIDEQGQVIAGDVGQRQHARPPGHLPAWLADGEVVMNSSKPTGTTMKAVAVMAIYLSTNCSPGPRESARPDHLAQPMQQLPDQHE